MLKFHLFLFFALLTYGLKSQNPTYLDSEDKAYLYHTVMKSPTLKKNISKFFHYRGEMIWKNDTLPNYDSLELLIIQNPDSLEIYINDLDRVSQGVLAEIANKIAIWKLNVALYYKSDTSVQAKKYLYVRQSFYDILKGYLPNKTLKNDSIDERITSILNPDLGLKEKLSALNSFVLFSEFDKQKIIEAINTSLVQWIQDESKRYFNLLGGQTIYWENHLMGVGDGSVSSKLITEQKKDKKSRWYIRMPKSIGFFSYQTDVVEKNKRKKIVPRNVFKINGKTYQNEYSTLLHFDVWGYKKHKQTTIVVEKNNKQYVLYCSKGTKLLTPDSTFGKGRTYFSYINELSKNIDELQDKMYGKKGFKLQLEILKKEKNKTLLDIKKTEFDLSELRNSRISITKSGKKKRQVKQQELMTYYDKLSSIEIQIKKITEEMEKAHLVIAQYRERKANMFELYGTNHMNYIFENGVYVFEDSTIFDPKTQDLILLPTKKVEKFEVRLLGVPKSIFSNTVEESMVHFNQTEVEDDRYTAIDIKLTDNFGRDKYEIKNKILRKSDSIACMELMQMILNNSKVKTQFEGNGIGTIQDGILIKDENPLEVSSYSSLNQENDYSVLRTSILKLRLNNEVSFIVKSFTDPLISPIKIKNKKINKLMRMYPKINKNDVLSAIRTKSIVYSFQNEFNDLCNKFLMKKESNKVINLFNKIINKSRIKVGEIPIRFVDLYL